MTLPGRSMMCSGIAIFSGLAVVTISFFAHATNGNKTRVQVRWPTTSTACIETIDRAGQATWTTTYDFDGPDDLLPADSQDELDDSRRHQFFAFCRHHHRQEFIPRWISVADHERAIAFGFKTSVFGPEDILDTHPGWNACALRFQSDDARLPITHAQAAIGATWNLTDVPTGSYVIEAYTWEPPDNVWTHPPRPGIVRVWDSHNDTSPPPAAALDDTGQIGYRDDPFFIRGCGASDPGSQLTAYFAVLPAAGQEPNWVAIGTPIAFTEGAIEIPFSPPLETLTTSSVKFMFRVDLVDPTDRIYTAYSRGEIVVLNMDAPSDSTTDTGSDSTSGISEKGGASGCRMSPNSATPWFALLCCFCAILRFRASIPRGS